MIEEVIYDFVECENQNKLCSKQLNNYLNASIKDLKLISAMSLT